MSEKKYYVYVHRYASGPKQGEVFYVGKGSGDRAEFQYGRSEYWNRVVSKYGFTPEIVIYFFSEICAFSFEKSLISFYGGEALVNLTDGGEGQSGLIHSEETREKMSMSHKGKKFSDNHRKNLSSKLKSMPIETFQSFLGKKHSKDTIIKMSEAKLGKVVSEETKKKISDTRKSKKYTYSEEYREKRSELMSSKKGTNSLNHDKNIYTFLHDNGQEDVMTRVEFCSKHPVSLEAIGRLVRGKCKSTKGWRIKRND